MKKEKILALVGIFLSTVLLIPTSIQINRSWSNLEISNSIFWMVIAVILLGLLWFFMLAFEKGFNFLKKTWKSFVFVVMLFLSVLVFPTLILELIEIEKEDIEEIELKKDSNSKIKN